MAVANTCVADSAVTSVLLDELSRIRGASLVALFDGAGLCTALRRSSLICGPGTYRVLSEVSSMVPGRGSISIDVDGRLILARRLHEDGYAMVATSAAADAYETEVRLIEAVAGHALRSNGVEPAPPALLASVTIPPPANSSPSELPPLEASLILRVGSLRDLYRDLDGEVDLDEFLAS